MKRKPLVQILVGPVASGKSTFSAKRAEEGAVIVSNDSIVLGVHGGNYQLYLEHLKPLYKAIHSNMIFTAIAAGFDVVVDDVHHKRGTRDRIVSMAKAADVNYQFVLFDRLTAAEHAERRMKHDPRGMAKSAWLEVILRHFEEWQVLEPDELIVAIRDFEWNARKLNLTRPNSLGPSESR